LYKLKSRWGNGVHRGKLPPLPTATHKGVTENYTLSVHTISSVAKPNKLAERKDFMSEYIPVATASTIYYKPKTEQEMEQMTAIMEVGDMIFSKWAFQASGGIWYTMGLMDKNDPTTKMLFPNIVLSETPLKPLTRWGMARMNYLKEHKKFVAAQFGTVGLHRHCLEIEEQAEERKRNMMAAIRKDPNNKVTEQDKAADPMAWVGRMNNYQHSVHEIIYAELIYA